MQFNTPLEGIQGGVKATFDATQALEGHRKSTEAQRVNLRTNMGGEPGDIYDMALKELHDVIVGVKASADDLHNKLETSLTAYRQTHRDISDQATTLKSNVGGMVL